MCLISVAFQQPLWSDNGQLGGWGYKEDLRGGDPFPFSLPPPSSAPTSLSPPVSSDVHTPTLLSPTLARDPTCTSILGNDSPSPHLPSLSPHGTSQPPSKPGWEVSDLWGAQKCCPTLSLTFGSLLFFGGQEKAEAWEEEVGEKGERRRENMFLIC
ncbi:unnamed protein product [Rangifer tarandus platyrhynchus]|uniref:Uncharacterized protein n=1 Tax=Rangifer tarandus platyrhynchus TaxID=3082113 RepID=A0AC59ZDE4_RANTA